LIGFVAEISGIEIGIDGAGLYLKLDYDVRRTGAAISDAF